MYPSLWLYGRPGPADPSIWVHFRRRVSDSCLRIYCRGEHGDISIWLYLQCCRPVSGRKQHIWQRDYYPPATGSCLFISVWSINPPYLCLFLLSLAIKTPPPVCVCVCARVRGENGGGCVCTCACACASNDPRAPQRRIQSNQRTNSTGFVTPEHSSDMSNDSHAIAVHERDAAQGDLSLHRSLTPGCG